MRTLAELPYKQKREVVHWRKIPRDTCDMNYRPPAWHPRGRVHAVLTFLMLVSLCSAGGIWLVRNALGVLFDSETAALAFSVAGAFLAIPVLLDLYQPFPGLPFLSNRYVSAGLCVLAGPVIWLLIVAAFRVDSLAGSMAILVLVALPVVSVTADQFATHFIYWMTAHFRIDRQTMLACRADWEQRFVGFPHPPPRKPDPTPADLASHQHVLRVRDDYLFGFVRFAAALILPMVLVVCAVALDFWESVGPTIIACQLAALVGLALSSGPHPRTAMQVFANALEHWIGYARDQHTTPWVFQSPSGRQRLRQLWFALSVCLLSSTIVPIGCTLRVSVDRAAAAETSTGRLASRWSALAHDWIVPAVHAIAAGQFQHAGYLALLIVVSGLVPPAIFLLGLFVITGPVLVAHDLALERRGAYEQHHEWTAFDGYTERLRNSRHRLERDSLMIGFISFTD